MPKYVKFCYAKIECQHHSDESKDITDSLQDYIDLWE